MSRACTPILVGVTSPVSEIKLGYSAYIQVLPTISLYALIKRHALKIGSSLY